MNLNEVPAKKNTPGIAPQYRRLKSDQLVRHGDFVRDAHQGFALWEGPTGFRADAFVRPIYRREEMRSNPTEKTK